MRMYLLRVMFVGSLLACAACSSTVWVKTPPRFDLGRFQTLGLVKFSVENDSGYGQTVSEKFLASLQEGQPGTPVVDLGSAAEALQSSNLTPLNRETYLKIGQTHHVDGVIIGSLRFSQSKPKIKVDIKDGLKLDSLSANVRLDGELDVKIIDTASGAVVWAGSSDRWITLTDFNASSAGSSGARISSAEQQYERLLLDMVHEVTADFRCQMRKQPKNLVDKTNRP